MLIVIVDKNIVTSRPSALLPNGMHVSSLNPLGNPVQSRGYNNGLTLTSAQSTAMFGSDTTLPVSQAAVLPTAAHQGIRTIVDFEAYLDGEYERAVRENDPVLKDRTKNLLKFVAIASNEERILRIIKTKTFFDSADYIFNVYCQT